MNLNESHKDELADRSYAAALVALSVLLISSLLFPDTLVDVGFKIAGFRISPISLIYFITAPALIIFIWSRRKKMPIRAVDSALLIMWAFILLRNLFAVESSWELGLLIAFAVYLPVLYLGGYALGSRQETFSKLFTLIAALTVIISLYTFIEFFLSENILFQGISRVPVKSEVFYRSSSTLGHPLILGLYIVQTMPFLVYCFMKARSFISRIFWGAGMFLALNALFISYTKGSWLTIGLLALVFLVIFGRRLSRLMAIRLGIVLLLSALSILMIISFYQKSVEFNVASEDRVAESFTMRWMFWKESLEIFQEQPFLGTGLRRGPEHFNIENANPNSVGNIYIRMLLEIGIAGLALSLVFFALMARKAHQILRDNKLLHWESITIIASMAAVAIQGMTSETFLIWVCFLLFFMEAGLVRAIYESQRNESARQKYGIANRSYDDNRE